MRSKWNILMTGALLAGFWGGSTGLEAAETSAAKKAAVGGRTPAIYVVDTAASGVHWVGKKVTGQHNGAVKIKSGEIQVAQNGTLVGGKVILDMTGITVDDLKDPGSNGKLTGHLKSGDFFAVDSFPTSEFVITDVQPIADAKQGSPTHKISGNLTIKGQTHPLQFNAAVHIKADTAGAAAKGIAVDRTLYGIRYGSGKFFEKLGDKAIDDLFIINMNLAANKKK